ncbi:excalibur calcium-binding domain-containing protein [Xylanimonas sp. McL0601]|uniref:excalibur calcium-binding domain-containing protein n=1 Tax=Xylanimonas sp. McL0601 TaxID=3414739 RepID=UPI003CFA8878
MAARFNPPPGWQVPAGFRPEPGWSPDPAWPPAPGGWDYWIEDAPTAATPAAPVARPAADRTTLLAPVPAPAVPVTVPAADRTTLLAPVPAPAVGHDVLHEALPLATLTAPGATPPPPPEPAPAAPPRTRSVARQGAAIPLPDGPLGHLRSPGADAPTPGAPSSGAPSSGAPSSGTGTGGTRRSGRSNGQMMIAGVAIACFAFGVIVGVVSSVLRTSDAGQAVADAQRAQAQVIEDRDDLNSQRTALEDDKAALAQREADVTQRETAVSQKEAELTTQQQQLDQQTQQSQQAQQPQDGGKQNGFQTCDQLRQSGIATPIRRGDPGYSRFLDLDDNGLACE